MVVTKQQLRELGREAWRVRELARVVGETRVGCALLASDGRVFSGCNVEHKFRCHDVHAEVNAITSMVSAGSSRCVAVVVAAEKVRFTPCGGCMDWIMELGGPEAIVGFQGVPGGEVVSYTAAELMPKYPS